MTTKTKWACFSTGLAFVFISVLFISTFGDYELLASDKKEVEIPKYLTCRHVQGIVREILLRDHYTFNAFTPEYSKRTFENMFKMNDPLKIIFLKEDIDKMKLYGGGENLSENINKYLLKSDCGFVNEFYNVYFKRINERNEMLKSILSKGFDYSKKEVLETDSEKYAWAKTPEEIRERLSKIYKYSAISLKEEKISDKEIAEKLTQRFERSYIKRNDERTLDDSYGDFLNALISSLDPHSLYSPPVQAVSFKEDLSTFFYGIGASLQFQDGYTMVVEIVPGGPADKDGTIFPGDKILAVDSGTGKNFEDVVNMDLTSVVSKIRGKKDTIVKLRLERMSMGKKEQIVVALKRDKIAPIESVARSEIFMIKDKKVGVVILPRFYRADESCREGSTDCVSSSRDIGNELKKLKKEKVDLVLFDLRGNGGGYLDESRDIAGHFITTGTVVQTANRNKNVELYQDKNPEILWDGPLAVLIDSMSASASEIVAGALKDYGRALILGGPRTFGKGTVQQVRPLDFLPIPSDMTPPLLKYTTSKFFQPSGKSNQATGITSHVEIPLYASVLPSYEDTNPFVIPNSSIDKAPQFQKISDPFEKVAPELSLKSQERIKDTKYLKEALEFIHKEKTEAKTEVVLEYPKKEDSKKEDSKKEDSKKEDSKKESSKKEAKNSKAKENSSQTGSSQDSVSSLIQASKEAKEKRQEFDEEVWKEAAFILLDATNLLGSDYKWAR